jgi:hypothetical protein
MSFGDWFWTVFVIFFVFVPLLMFWGFILFDIFRRTDMTGWQKVLWVIALFVLPYLGALIYMLVRPPSPHAEPYYGSPPPYPAE